MNTFLKRAILLAASHSGLLDSYGFLRRKFTKSQVAILMYHRVAPKEDDWSLAPHSPESFETHIRHLCRNYEIISLDELIPHLNNGNWFPERAVAITFDDGYKDNYQYAYPILKKHKVPATVFLATSHISQGGLFWTDKVRYVIWNMPPATLDLDELGVYSITDSVERRAAAYRIPETMKKLPADRRNHQSAARPSTDSVLYRGHTPDWKTMWQTRRESNQEWEVLRSAGALWGECPRA